MNSSSTHPVFSPRPNSWKGLAAAAAILALSAFLPAASAQCGSVNLTRAQAVPVVPSAALSEPKANSSVARDAGTSGPTAQVSIAGLWQLSFLSGGQVADVAFDAWHSDGTEILNDFTNPINGNVCLGAWEQTGSLTYKLKHPSWYFDASGNLLGTEVIHETVRLTEDGSHFSGTFLIDVYDTQGSLLQQFSGTLKASRITP
jgi:hypothetical protein